MLQTVLMSCYLSVICIFQVAAYDTVEKKMAFFDPSRAKEFLFISGTKVRDSFLQGSSFHDF